MTPISVTMSYSLRMIFHQVDHPNLHDHNKATDMMADSIISLSHGNCTQINPFNWDLHEINRYRDEKCFAYDVNRIKWTDTYEMLRLFIKWGVSQPGIWSAPGGKYKKFCSTNENLIITWNYESGNLSFKGETGDTLRALLINMCTDSGFLLKH